MIKGLAKSSGLRESRKQVSFVSSPQGHPNFDYVSFPPQLKAWLTSRGSHLHVCYFASPAVLSDFLQYYIMPLSLDAISCLLLTVRNYRAEGQTTSVDSEHDAQAGTHTVDN